MNRVRGADWETGAAVDAFCGVYVHLGRGLKFWFIQFGMNAIGGADVDAESVFYAGVGNYVGHGESSLLCEMSNDEMSSDVKVKCRGERDEEP